MNEPDLTGWTPHDGKTGDLWPEALTGNDDVLVLLRGKPDAGPMESGPAPVPALDWRWSQFRADFKPSPLAVLKGEIPGHQPAGDIIAWRRANDHSACRRYRHVRADLGMGVR